MASHANLQAEGEEPADITRIVEKVRKLLALGTSSNEHEAALAVSRAQSLLAKYDLTMESIENMKSDSRTSIGKRGDTITVTEGKPEGWKKDVLEAVAYSADCVVTWTYEEEKTPNGRKTRTLTKGVLIGFKHDVEVASYSLAFLIRTIEGMAQAYADKLWAEIRVLEREEGITHQEAESLFTARTGRHPLKAKLYYIKGAAEEVVRTLQMEKERRNREAQAANPHAIVLQKKAAIEDFLSVERTGKTRGEWQAHYAEVSRKEKEKHDLEKARLEAEGKICTCYRCRDANSLSTSTATKPLTEAQKRKQEEKDRRWSERYWEKKDREAAREEAKKDKEAYKKGREEGAAISVTPALRGQGIKGGIEG